MAVVRGVIFDYGGVLVRGMDATRHQLWEERFGLLPGRLVFEVWGNPLSELAVVGRVEPEEVWSYLAERFGLAPPELTALRGDFFAGETLDAKLVSFLRDLRPRVRTAILSNCWQGTRRQMEEQHGLGDMADELILSYEEGVAKPDARIFAVAAARLGLRLDELLFVDDFPPNVAGAQAAGMCGILFESAEQVMQEVRAALD